jgi:hypothetical protein
MRAPHHIDVDQLVGSPSNDRSSSTRCACPDKAWR